MRDSIKLVIKYTLIIIALFYGFQISFWLLNQASSLANVGGFLIGAVLGTIVYHLVKEKISDFTNKNK